MFAYEENTCDCKERVRETKREKEKEREREREREKEKERIRTCSHQDVLVLSNTYKVMIGIETVVFK